MKKILIVGLAIGCMAAQHLARAQDAPQVDPNYNAALSAAVMIQNAQAATRVADANARTVCFQQLSELAKSAEGTDVSRVAGIVALGITCAGGGGGGFGQGAGAPMPVSIPAPPAPTVKGDWVSSIINAPAAFFEGAMKLAPTIAQYLLGRVQARSNETIALAGAQERGALYGAFASMHGSSMGSMERVASQGFITIGQIPQGSVYTVNGSGVNFGSGALSFNPITGSYNPRDCRGGAAAAGGAGGTGTATVPGGAAGPGGAAAGGTC